jgi:DivIVA domain-containing protein
MRMTAEEIVQRGFPTKVRGVSETEVRAFLKRVAEEVERLGAREDELLAQIEELENDRENKPKVSKHELLENLGEQTARVLSSAEAAAETMISEAKEKSEEMISSAKAQAESILKEAQDKSDAQLEDVHARVRSLHENAERDVNTLVEEARVFGREIFQESVVTREQILKDLLRRRELLLEQIDELRKGREELLESYKVVKTSFHNATDALQSVEERASSELMATPIDVDALLKAPVELPVVLESGAPVPHNPDAPKFVAPQAEESPQTSEKVAVQETETLEQAEVPADETQDDSDSDIPSITGKRKTIKTYMKGALGVGEDHKPAVINPDDVKSDLPEESVAIKIVPKTVTEKEEKATAPAAQDDITPKKDVGALFQSLKEQKQTPKTAQADEIEKSDATTVDAKAETTTATKDADSKKSGKKKSSAKKDPVALRDDVLSSAMSSVLRKAKRQLQDEQNELLEGLRTVKPKKRVAAENLLPDEQTQLKIWEEAIREDLEGVFASGAKTVSGQSYVYDDNALKSAVAWVITPLREALTQTIDEGDQAEAANRVGAKYREWRNTDLKNALMDAMCSAYNNGVVTAADKDATVTWKVVKAGQCPDCDDNALEPTKAGEAFPTGQVAPPAHAGCKCVLVVA